MSKNTLQIIVDMDKGDVEIISPDNKLSGMQLLLAWVNIIKMSQLLRNALASKLDEDELRLIESEAAKNFNEEYLVLNQSAGGVYVDPKNTKLH